MDNNTSFEDGETISLTKTSGAVSLAKFTKLRKGIIGLGWKPRITPGVDFDLDASMLAVPKTGKPSLQTYAYYENPSIFNGAITCGSDNQNGRDVPPGQDAERINIDFSAIPPDIGKLLPIASIHQWQDRQQHFGMVQDAYVRLIDAETNKVLIRFDLTENATDMAALIPCILDNRGSEYAFVPNTEKYRGGLQEALGAHGLRAA